MRLSQELAGELFRGDYLQAMKRRLEFKCTMVAARTTKPTCGNIAGQEES